MEKETHTNVAIVEQRDTPICVSLLYMWLMYSIQPHECAHTHACSNMTDMPTWYGDLLRFRRGGAVLVSDNDSDRVGPWTKGYLCTTTDGSGQVGDREGLLLPSAVR